VWLGDHRQVAGVRVTLWGRSVGGTVGHRYPSGACHVAPTIVRSPTREGHEMDTMSGSFVFMFVMAAAAAVLGGWLIYRAVTMKREDEDPRPRQLRKRRDEDG
jgi:hypothetical protein